MICETIISIAIMGILLYEYAKNGNTYQFWYLLDQIYIIRFYLVHMGNITQIKLEVNTAADLSNSHRVFFGFDADSDVDRPQGREFRCRRNGSSDANPFRNGLKDITFGNGGNAEKANDNNPRNPQLDSDLVGRAYLPYHFLIHLKNGKLVLQKLQLMLAQGHHLIKFNPCTYNTE